MLKQLAVLMVLPASIVTSAADEAGTHPNTNLHYAAHGDFDASGHYLPSGSGFNLADVSNAARLNSLPRGTLALFWLGACNGADANFRAKVTSAIRSDRLFGFYLMDEPNPDGFGKIACPASDLKEESDWIHRVRPSIKTFMVLSNSGSDFSPDYTGTYSFESTHIDLFGLDPYPCKLRWGGCDFDAIDRSVRAAEAAGIERGRLIPIYQAFGGGPQGAWILPTPQQETIILEHWGRLVSNPIFDYVYDWRPIGNEVSVSSSPELRLIFKLHNSALR